MGRQQHSKDRMFITASEWATEYGGHKKKREMKNEGTLPFDCCALTLRPFVTPMCTKDGVIFDMLAIMPFVKEHGRNPVTGAKCSTKDLIRLKMAKNAAGLWQCPVTCKVFNNFSKVVAVGTTGNVYATEAIDQLCLKANELIDLMDSTPFLMSDLIYLHDPESEKLCALRDLANFVHLREMREKHTAEQNKKAHGENIQSSESTQKVLQKARENVKEADELRNERERLALLNDSEANKGLTDAYKRVRLMQPTTDEVSKGSLLTAAATSASFTSTVMALSVSAQLRSANDAELQAGRWKCLKSLGKKGYVQISTNLGVMNIEVHCDIVPRAAENFLTHCASGYYDGLNFHRIVQGFVAQAGDPKGDGTGGESIWGGEFRDEFDSRLLHDKAGVLSYANSGLNKNRSQFFVTLAEDKPSTHLDYKHTVFGKVVGGLETIRRIAEVEVDAEDDHRPRRPLAILGVKVFVNPLAEADAQFEADITEAIAKRPVSKEQTTNKKQPLAIMPRPPPSKKQLAAQAPAPAPTAASGGIGKYLPKAGAPKAGLVRKKTQEEGDLPEGTSKKQRKTPVASPFSSW